MSSLIAIDEARRRVLAEVRPLGAEHVELERALGRVLAEDAVRAGGRSALRQLGDGRLRAGGRARRPSCRWWASPAPGTPSRAWWRRAPRCASPPGRWCPRAPTWWCRWSAPRRTASACGCRRSSRATNIRRAGEDMRAGEVVLRAGTPLGPAELGVAASVGRAELALRRAAARGARGDRRRAGAPRASRWPPAASTAPTSSPWPARWSGRAPSSVSRASAADTAEGTRAALERALADADVVCVSGGVSVGPHDHVRGAMGELGVEERFWGVSLRPGKPTWFGVRDGTLAFGLPGNPVSAMVTFQLFVRPALAALQGADPAARRITAAAGRGRAPQPASRGGRARAAERRRRAARDAHRPPGLAPAHLDAGRRRPGADPRRGRASWPPGEPVAVELL